MTTNNFLPDGYKEPSANNRYFKLQEGENRVRILTAPIVGWEDWHEKKPMRYYYDKKPAKPYDPKRPIRHFWAMVVWNYKEKKIQIWQVTQASIRGSIKSLSENEDWGAPYKYDLKVMKSGEGVDTVYAINPCPAKPVSDEIKRAFQENPCCLDALYYNEDPFSVDDEGNLTKGAFE